MLLPSEVRVDFERAFGDAELIVLHSAPRSIGHVAGGIEGVLAALLDALGDRTLLVPTFTTSRTDPATWCSPAAPEERWDAIREELPPFDPARSIPRGMGRLVDVLTRMPETLRSFHPVESVAALGPRAAELVSPHPLDDPMGPRSPWARAYAWNARVVMVGVGLERCSLLHHAERMAEPPYLAIAAYGMPLEIDGQRRWVEVESGNNCSEGFPALGPDLGSALERRTIGHAPTLVVGARMLVDVARVRLAREPASLLCSAADCLFCVAARAATEAARDDIPTGGR